MGRPSLRDVRREQILTAFEACILKYGFERTTLKRIGAEAGLNRNLIRHYFGNRDALTQALLDRVVAQTMSDMRVAMTGADADGDIDGMVAYLTGPFFPNDRDDALVDALAAAMHRYPSLKAQQRAKHASYLGAIQGKLGQAFPRADPGDVHDVAYGLLCLTAGSAVMYDEGFAEGERGDLSRAAHVLVSSILGTPQQIPHDSGESESDITERRA